jgi:hypothetical protein
LCFCACAASTSQAIHNLSQSLEYEGAHNILTNFLPEIIKNLLECQQRYVRVVERGVLREGGREGGQQGAGLA